jgi:predicted SAM-dependent methyltransferase
MGKFHSKDFSKIAREYCKGEGIEIGGLHSRLQVNAKVKNLDYMDTKRLKEKYKNDKNINLNDLWEVDIVSQAWDLSKIESNSLDFVMSSHVLEHLPNPGVAIQEWIRAVKPGGTVFFIVPDMRFTFDKDRNLTHVDALLEKYKSRTQKVPYDTYEEFSILTNGKVGKTKREITKESIQRMYDDQANIHVHTFTEDSIRNFCDILSKVVGFKVKMVKRFDMHINVVLIKNL